MTKLKKNAAVPLAAASNQPLSVEALLKRARKNRTYPGTQQNLYTYSRLAWNNYLGKLADFTDFSDLFTQALGDDALDAITAAEALPSFEALSDGHSVARNDLMKMSEQVLSKWQDMKVFFAKAFTPSILPSKLRAAGSEQYKPAAKFSWDSVAELIRMTTTFLSENSAALLADNNMPAAFPAAFAAAGAAFTAQRAVFLAKEKEARDGIELKFKANEEIYASLVQVANAGKAIYRKDANERRNFTISKLLKEVRGNSPSGIKGFVTTGGSPAVPLSGVLVADQNNPQRFAISAADGSFELKVPSGMQTVTVTLAGYAPQVLERRIEVGTMHRQSFSLVAEPVLEMEEALPVIEPQETSAQLLASAISEKSNGVAVH